MARAPWQLPGNVPTAGEQIGPAAQSALAHRAATQKCPTCGDGGPTRPARPNPSQEHELESVVGLFIVLSLCTKQEGPNLSTWK